MEETEKKGRVCVTGGTGFVASWLIMRLLQRGYTVNATVRSHPDGSRKDISFLRDLPGAAERLHIFNADFENPDSFDAAIQGCIGVFHVAHPTDLENKETVEKIANKSVKATLGILKACLNSKTVKRVVYTSSAATVMVNEKGPDVLDEEWWSDVDYIRKNLSAVIGASYALSKIATERAALEFAESNSLDVVSVIPTWINGPFVCPGCPGTVRASLAMIMGSSYAWYSVGNENQIKYHKKTPFVHTDDVASAHIFLFEYPEAKGRYICSAVEIPIDKLFEFFARQYPEFKILNKDSLINKTIKIKSLSSKKLLDTGFRYKYGLEEMYDEAIECCKKKGVL